MAWPPSKITLLKWFGTGIQVIGVGILSSRILPANIAFCVLLSGSTAWVIAATIMREWSVMALNTAFTVSNIVGIWRWAHP